ncbi:hypothetical protein QBC33DRAFT_281513 [Phialemonium atrogriseum]|uniref:Uncharacterized protein n=1 Tax=Phialemonium atrogriseum TaxID=1093897 RepID=A0AAJ0BUW2_9PEZI|nr:uncharacterized protein QBC33DRAFT_281513 [Phialemonium atrogriseum]KAK1762486.1 hypothetical protein QBC33DRAFT_281513 [Phialemonium atrogriseum]
MQCIGQTTHGTLGSPPPRWPGPALHQLQRPRIGRPVSVASVRWSWRCWELPPNAGDLSHRWNSFCASSSGGPSPLSGRCRRAVPLVPLESVVHGEDIAQRSRIGNSSFSDNHNDGDIDNDGGSDADSDYTLEIANSNGNPALIRDGNGNGHSDSDSNVCLPKNAYHLSKKKTWRSEPLPSTSPARLATLPHSPTRGDKLATNGITCTVLGGQNF